MKKNIFKQKLKKKVFQGFFVVFVVGFFSETVAQIQNNSVVYISDNTALYLASGSYNFGVTSASTQTTRTSFNFGRLIFNASATSGLASDSHYVDGYVSTLGSGPFVFPIGDGGRYAPAKIMSPVSTEINGAYYDSSPISVYGSTFGSSVFGISPIEYWDINGMSSASISLSWRPSSGISVLTNSDLNNLTIVGYNGTEWIQIDSQVDVTAFTGGISSIANGTISSLNTVDLSSFYAFTLGTKTDLKTDNFNSFNVGALISNQNLIIQSSEVLESVQVFDIRGRLIEQYDEIGKLVVNEKFYHAQEVYIVKIKAISGSSATKKIINYK